MSQCKYIKAPYAAAASVPLIKSPSLRVPRPVELPQDIHPLPDSVNAYFVYPFTIEPHTITLESSRRTTLAAHTARREAYLRSRDEEKERRRREALRRIAPGFEPHGGPLVPTKSASPRSSVASPPQGMLGEGIRQQPRSVMDDLVDQLAALEGSSTKSGPSPPLS
ncbi:hypothetical protein CPB84DRAFT_1815323 [Gymnopilus junonius]|uniref:Uncharacterized protein n=1 Tax=Gymnopilus junonius TaxID=109634 RepID=A0A9P5NKY3_GYMJU|nr:hypothetical protein CPB84DRAFT_1815323 [Gymnopilus junonius]